MHWINALAIFIMIGSGWKIYDDDSWTLPLKVAASFFVLVAPSAVPVTKKANDVASVVPASECLITASASACFNIGGPEFALQSGGPMRSSK
jgi:hypothetical protein